MKVRRENGKRRRKKKEEDDDKEKREVERIIPRESRKWGRRDRKSEMENKSGVAKAEQEKDEVRKKKERKE